MEKVIELTACRQDKYYRKDASLRTPPGLMYILLSELDYFSTRRLSVRAE